MQIKELLETVKITCDNEMVYIYDYNEHFQRLCKSIGELNFAIPANISDLQNFYLFIKNQIKNEAQYYFKKPVQFIEENLVDLLKPKSKPSELFKLRLLYDKNAKLEIFIEKYNRDFNKSWKVKLLSSEEFHVNSQDECFRHKFYPRLDFSKYLLPNGEFDEVIWTNERNEICEGSFTNVFFQNEVGEFHTPYLEANILDGLMRAKVIKATNAIERSIKADEFGSFKKIFLSNAMIGFIECRHLTPTS